MATLIAGAAYWVLWPQIRKNRLARSWVAAESYEKEGDYRRALLTLEQAIQLYPQSIETKRRLANFYERLGQRAALDVWQQVVDDDPRDPQSLLGLARSALLFGNLERTRTTLAKLRALGPPEPGYYRLASGLALLTQDKAALEQALAELTRLQPEDLRAQLNLAVVRLQLPDPSKAEAGRAALVQLARTEALRIRAVVELLNDLARRWPRPSPERVAAFEQLARTLTPPRGPRLDPPELGDPVERLVAFAMHQPAPEPEDAGALLSWMMRNGRAPAAFAWLDSLPARIQASPLVIAAASEAALQTADWTRLQPLLLAGGWGPVPAAAVEGAFAMRRDLTPPARPREADTRWAAAIESCQASLPGLRMLLRLSETWDWPAERRQALIAITRGFASETWAWRQLLSYALAQGDSEQLWQTYLRWSRAAPGDLTVRTEAAIIGLLLQKRGAPTSESTGELVQQHPESSAAAIAHALALWRARRLDEALAQLASLPPATYDEPRYALGYGLLLSEAGRARESEQQLNRAALDRLLPDEVLLIEQAHARNRLRSAGPGGF